MAVDIMIPAFGESVTSGVIQRWVIKDGGYANKDDIVLELETDKVTGELRAEEAGVVRHLAKEGDTVAVGQTVGRIEPGAGAGTKTAPAKSTAAVAEAKPKSAPAPAATAVMNGGPEQGNADADGIRATPLARKLAAEHNVDLARISVAGGQRIREQDVLNFVSKGAPANGATAASTSAGPVVRAGSSAAPAPKPQPAASA